MARFFINRPIVAMVIAIIMVIAGIVAFPGSDEISGGEIAPSRRISGHMVHRLFQTRDRTIHGKAVLRPDQMQQAGEPHIDWTAPTKSLDTLGVAPGSARLGQQVHRSRSSVRPRRSANPGP